jgi:FkbM family methyltransferase
MVNAIGREPRKSLMTFVSYAQNFEDVLLWRALRHIGQGFYIDVGAAHPDIDSVTRAFYDRGWSGINLEPVRELHARLTAARPRDTNLRLAAGQAAAESTVYVVAGTGLSTTDSALASHHEASGFDVRAQEASVLPLAELCRLHAPGPIHFLKIDAEGAEKAVLEGADFSLYRPWIVLVEATAPGTQTQTHEEWEPLLLQAGYRFLWFDGLNRFYAAEEHAAEIAPHFNVPVCVFDDFLRAADSEMTRRITSAEMQASELLERSMMAEGTIARAEALAHEWAHHARDAELRVRDAERRAQDAEHRAQLAEPRASGAERRSDVAEQRLATTEAKLQATAAELQLLGGALRQAQADAASLRASTSWRLTAPLRGASRLTRAIAGQNQRPTVGPVAQRPAPQQALPAAMPKAAQSSSPVEVPVSRIPASLSPPPVLHSLQAPERSNTVAMANTRIVHQFHSGSAVGDAITNAMLLIRTELRARGYRSDIFVEHLDPGLTHDLFPIDDMPTGDHYVLILHLSMGFDAYDRILNLPAQKILIYHNITPPAFFQGDPGIQHYVRLGREQLAGLRGRVSAALADSDYNAVELRRLGFDDPRACTLLFDLAALRRAARSKQRDEGKPFTLLFVGRIVANKGQHDLLEAFAAFHKKAGQQTRLVLVGREDGIGAAYAQALRARVHALGLDDAVEITGLVSDDELQARYRAADLYVSLSRHEGFGVPLVEAAAIGLPVLAWPAGAVAFTLGSQAGLLRSRAAAHVADRIAELANDPNQRADLAQAQHQALARFELDMQIPVLLNALARAGAAAPADADTHPLLAANLRYTVTGHVNGSYSLAAINRTLALALEQARPGDVRLLPVEGEPTERLDDIPAAEHDAIRALAARPPHETGPVVVISQHYPVYVPEDAGDALLAYVFWEESLLPADTVAVLNASFRGVLAPSFFVARALQDSGVSLPIHVVGFAPDLADFEALPGPPATSSGTTHFLHVSSAFARKGIDVLLAAYAQAFRATDPVRLVIKTFPNPHNDVQAHIDALRRTDPGHPAIDLIDADIERPAMLRLYAQADAIVLPTRGEGFNIPAAEAMAAGIPLVVTGHGGHMDFCADAARLVKFRLAPSRSHLATSMSLWAEPDIADLAAALGEIHRDRPAALARAQSAKSRIPDLFSAQLFAQRIEQASLDVLLRDPVRKRQLCIVSSWNVRCGVAEYSGALIEAMLYADPDLDVVVLADTRTQQAGLPQTRLRVRPVWTLNAPDIAQTLRRAAATEDAQMVLIEHQPGLMHWPVLAQVLVEMAAMGRVVATTLHNTRSLEDLGTEDRELTLAGLAGATRVIVHTPADMARLQEMGLQDNLVLIPQGAPDAPHRGAERTLIERDTVTIGCCGFLLPGKGIPALVTAAGLLKPRWPKLRLLLMTAEYGDQSSRDEAMRTRAAIVAAGMEHEVELVTDFLPIEESRWRLGTCDMIVLAYEPSKEASSAALRMALSAGPLVAVTPIDLFDEAGNAVWRLPGGDPASIARGIGDILEDRDRRGKVQDAATGWLQERNWKAIATRTVGMLKGIYDSQ